MSDAAYEHLSSEELGLPLGARMPVRFTPARAWSPLVISFPHVGLAWPHDLPPKPQADFPRNADYDVHTLYESAPHWGAASVAAIYSRLVTDLNRAADDVSPRIVPDHPAPRPRHNPGIASAAVERGADRDSGRPGRGVVWTQAIGDVPLLTPPLPYAHFRDRIDRFHAPYYRALEILLERRRQRFGFAILLDAHSMPSSVGPDLVLGTLDGDACDSRIQRAALAALRIRRGDGVELRVALNEPYRGGELVRRFGRPRQGLHALQLEVSRGLYMDERSCRLYSTEVTSGEVISGTTRFAARGTADEAEVPMAAAQNASRARAQRQSSGRSPSPPHRVPVPAQPRKARRLAELRDRVNSLVRSLASRGGDQDLHPSRSVSLVR